MPALHAKIKRGRVDYPNFLSSDCKDILSRMLVVDSKQRATLSEIMYHPWMMKGYDKPPESFVPFRKPIQFPLDPIVIKDMSGFEFGTEEQITENLTHILESPEYQNACRTWYRNHELETAAEKKPRHFSLDQFYKKRTSIVSSGNSLSPEFTNSSASSSSHYNDPTNAYHPLLSIYFLVTEKHERQKQEHEKQQQQQQQQIYNVSVNRNSIEVPPILLPDAAHVGRKSSEITAAATAATESTGLPSSGSGSLHVPRARSKTQGTTDYSEKFVFPFGMRHHNHQQQQVLPQQQQNSPQTSRLSSEKPLPFSPADSHGSSLSASKREAANGGGGFASNLLRRFSTKRKPVRDYQQSMPQQSPQASTHHYDLITGSPLRGGTGESALGRSTSMSEGTYYNTHSRKPIQFGSPPPLEFKYPPENSSGAIATTTTNSPHAITRRASARVPVRGAHSAVPSVDTRLEGLTIGAPNINANSNKKLHPSARAKSLGYVRKDSSASGKPLTSDQQPPGSADIADEFFDEVMLDVPSSSGDNDSRNSSVQGSAGPGGGLVSGGASGSYGSSGIVAAAAGQARIAQQGMPSIDYPKQVFLKGFFSVQSTSTKSLAFIRSDIIRVLTHLGVEFKEMRGGFMCIHRPSIKIDDEAGLTPAPLTIPQHGSSPHQQFHLSSSSSPPSSPQATTNTPSSTEKGHWRKLSFGSGIFNGSRRRGGGGNHAAGDSTNYILDSDFSTDSVVNAGGGGGGNGVGRVGAGGSDMLGFTSTASSVRTPLQFEIYIVRVPLLTLHGVQFKKLAGNSWQYKSLASKILSELRL